MAARRSGRGKSSPRHASMLIMAGDLAILAICGWLTYKSIAAGEAVFTSVAVGLVLYGLGWLGLHWLLRGRR